ASATTAHMAATTAAVAARTAPAATVTPRRTATSAVTARGAATSSVTAWRAASAAIAAAWRRRVGARGRGIAAPWRRIRARRGFAPRRVRRLLRVAAIPVGRTVAALWRFIGSPAVAGWYAIAAARAAIACPRWTVAHHASMRRCRTRAALRWAITHAPR